MKKLIVSILTIGMVASVAVSPALAGKKKKSAKPVATTMYLHGNAPVGDGVAFVQNIESDAVMTMDGNEPSESYPKSMSYSLPIGNSQCTGNPLFPSWEGRVAGRVKGDVKLIANFLAAPGTVTARLWVDTPFSSCTSSAAGTDAFVPPIGEVVVTVPPGQNEVEIVFEDIDAVATFNMIVELHQNSPTSQGRVLFDSPSFASRVEFPCIPASGKSCI